jgi:apolipoprotein N-acyltransferase
MARQLDKLFGILAALAGALMYFRFMEQKLWGHLPLALFFFFWAMVFMAKMKNADEQKLRRWILSSLSGILLALGFSFPVFLFIAFIPLLILQKEDPKSLFSHAFNAFLLWNILTTYWVANTALIAGIFAIVVNSLLMSIPFLLYHWMVKKMPHLAGPAFVSFWISFEMLHYHWDLAWPWLTLGNAWAIFPELIQWYSFTGVFGGTLWVLIVNFWIFNSSMRFKPGMAAFILVPILFSAYLFFTYQEKGEQRNVLIFQPNYEAHYEKFNVPEIIQAERYLELASPFNEKKMDYVLLPETVFGYVERNSILQYAPIERVVRGFKNIWPQAQMIAGISAYEYIQRDEKGNLPRSARTQTLSTGEEIHLEALNAAIQISPESADVPLYRKSKLVPGPEIFPFREVLFFLKPIVDVLGGTVSGFGIQKDRAVFESKSGRIAPVICYESVFGDYTTDYIKNGAEAIMIMTNDGWWDLTPGHKQHLHYASLRAIETRRSIARAANTGISAFINQRGIIEKRTNYNEAKALEGKIQLNREITFYVKWGDFIGRIAVFLAGLLIMRRLISF